MPKISESARVVHADPRDGGWITIQVRAQTWDQVHSGDQGTLDSENGTLVFRKQQPVPVGTR